MKVSDHAKKRIKERCGLPKKAIEKNALLALDAGITHSESKGRLKKYMDYLYLSHKQGGKLRIYGNHVYIFTNQDNLITVIPLPNEYRNAVSKIMTRKLLNETE